MIPTSQKSGQRWRYVFSNLDKNWKQFNYDDTSWKSGEGGFGDPKDSNPIIRTKWQQKELWLRKKFVFEGQKNEPLYIQVFHQFENETQFYLNGELIAEAPEHSNAYTFIKMDDKARSLLKSGENILAVHTKNNGRRAYFDAGLVVITK
jgi:hypothetical protein